MKFAIDNSALVEDFFSDVQVLGLVAPIRDYKFCWLLNRTLGYDFRLNADIEIQLAKRGRNYFFSVFEFGETGTPFIHYIYNNQFEGEYLLPEFRHLDFLWLTKGDQPAKDYVQDLKQSVKVIPGVQLVTEIEKELIKNKIHLVF